MDVLSATKDEDKIDWYENDGAGNFGPQHIITTNADGAFSVYAEDLDDDGDMDVLSASNNDNKIAWYENDGDGNFGTQQIITTNANQAYSVYAEDLDGDGDMDVLSASYFDDKIAWYENSPSLGVNENKLATFSVYPNPTTSQLTVLSNETITQIEIYNQLGQLVLSNSEQNTINISSVSSGVYFIKLKGENGDLGNQKVVKK
jgi:hypothetical protein